MQIVTKPFSERHLDIFNVVDSHKEECWKGAPELAKMGSMHIFGTHMLDGRILYISGYFEQLPGLMEVFMHPSIYVAQNKFAVIRHIKWWLGFIAREHKPRRIQTWGACTPESDKWLSHLGFTCEGVLNSYMPDGGPISIWGIECLKTK